MDIKNRLMQILNIYRLCPCYVAVSMLGQEKKNLIFDELECWNRYKKLNVQNRFNQMSLMLINYKEYRNLLVFRCGGGIGHLVKLLFPPMETLYINTKEIGPRLFIQHGFATNISAKSIGSDCWINQQVTVGYTFDQEPPIIGNGVRISAGAKVVGEIRIGDNAIIAANAAVVKDVGEKEIVGGVPAKVIGKNTEHLLYTDMT